MADVLTERRGDVAWIRLNRPDRMNAYDQAMAEELIDARPGRRRRRGDRAHRQRRARSAPADTSRTSPRPRPTSCARCSTARSALRGDPPAPPSGDRRGQRRRRRRRQRAGDRVRLRDRGRVGVARARPDRGSAARRCWAARTCSPCTIGEKRAKEVSLLCRRYPARAGAGARLGQRGGPRRASWTPRSTRWADELLADEPALPRDRQDLARTSGGTRPATTTCPGSGMLVQAIGSDDMVEGATAFMEKRTPALPRGAERPRERADLRDLPADVRRPRRSGRSRPCCASARTTHGDRVVPRRAPRTASASPTPRRCDRAERIARRPAGARRRPGDRVLIMAPNCSAYLLALVRRRRWPAWSRCRSTPPTGAASSSTRCARVAPRVAVIDAVVRRALRRAAPTRAARSSASTSWATPTSRGDRPRCATAGCDGASRSTRCSTATPQRRRCPTVTPRDLAAIFFTSGTTGLSKGVMMPHAHMYVLRRRVRARCTRLTDADTYMSVGPLFHGNAQFLAALPGADRRRAVRAARALQRHQLDRAGCATAARRSPTSSA